ncbi:MAG: S41 family peptidase [Brevinematia bacterium]
MRFMRKYPILFFGIILILILCVILAFYAPTFGQKKEFSQRDYIKASDTDDYYYYYEVFNQVYNLIKKNYVDEEKVDDKKLFQGAIKGMLESLGDPHTAFLSEEDFKELSVETSGKFGGLGIHISSKDDYIYVVSPIEGTPAFRAGIKPGDYIVKIEDQSTKGMPVDKAVSLLRGNPGTKVKITIKRGDEVFDKVLTREIINIPTVKWGWISEKDGIAYIKILQFSSTTFDSFKKAVDELSESPNKVKGIILDLRYNPGGLLDEVLRILDFIIPEGLILETRGRVPDSNSKTFASGRPPIIPLNIPIVVLINEGSASAAEIFSGVLQDTHRAVIVGTKSFGKGSVQTVTKLPDGSGVRITIARYYLPSGRTPDKVGITPDVEVDTFKIDKDTESLIIKVDKEGYIKDYMKNKTELTDQDVDNIYKLLQSKGISLDKRIIKMLAKREIPGIPLFDLDDDYIKKALDVLKNYSSYRKEIKFYK